MVQDSLPNSGESIGSGVVDKVGVMSQASANEGVEEGAIPSHDEACAMVKQEQGRDGHIRAGVAHGSW